VLSGDGIGRVGFIVWFAGADSWRVLKALKSWTRP